MVKSRPTVLYADEHRYFESFDKPDLSTRTTSLLYILVPTRSCHAFIFMLRRATPSFTLHTRWSPALC